jgi:hypothetical protein
MNIIKHDLEVRNSRVKRGEIVEEQGGRHTISVCSCGVPGCVYISYTPRRDLFTSRLSP